MQLGKKSIGGKLFMGFGAILIIAVILFSASLVAIWHEQDTAETYRKAIAMAGLRSELDRAITCNDQREPCVKCPRMPFHRSQVGYAQRAVIVLQYLRHTMVAVLVDDDHFEIAKALIQQGLQQRLKFLIASAGR